MSEVLKLQRAQVSRSAAGKMSGRWILAGSAVLLVLQLLACAPEIERRPMVMSPLAASEPARVVTVSQVVQVNPALGYRRTIEAGSQWRSVGRTSAGEVFRPVTGVFTVEGAHVHEAGLVIAVGRITGFYMLVEQAFVPLDPPVSVHLTEGGKQ